MNEPINNSYYRDKTYDLYFGKLCAQTVGLKDVPDWLLEDPTHGPSLYRVALNPERGLSGELYEENFKILKQGLEKAKQSDNNRQLEQLQDIYEAHAYWQETHKQELASPQRAEVASEPPTTAGWDASDWRMAVRTLFFVLAVAMFYCGLMYLILSIFI